MSTTETYSPDKDTYFKEESPTVNYGSTVFLFGGEGSGGGKRRTVVLGFDVSDLASPGDIVSATLNLVNLQVYGSSDRTMTVARLTQDFGDTTATWNTYDGSTAWPGGAGAAGDADTGLTTSSVVAHAAGDAAIDITNLVVDAITRRSGTLLVIIYMPAGTGVQSVTKWGSNNNATSGNRPTLDVVVAARRIWDGAAGDGDASNRDNWGGLPPLATDVAVLPNGSASITTGAITCHRLQIGRRYSGDIGAWTGGGITPSTAINVTASDVIAASVQSNWNLNLVGPSSTATTLRVMDTPSGDRACSAQGTYDALVSRTRGELWLIGATLGNVDAHGRGSIRITDTSAVRLTGFRARLTAGASSVVAAGRSSLKLDSTAVTDSTLSVAGDSIVRCLAEDVGSVTAYDGKVLWKGNTGSPVTAGAVVVYPGGLIDTRTLAASWSHDTGTITAYGGRVLTDAAMAGAIT